MCQSNERNMIGAWDGDRWGLLFSDIGPLNPSEFNTPVKNFTLYTLGMKENGKDKLSDALIFFDGKMLFGGRGRWNNSSDPSMTNINIEKNIV